LAVLSFIVGAIYKFLPSQRPQVKDLWLGVLVAVILLLAGKWLIGYYISRSVLASAYGPSSSVVALIIWIYYSMQIILLGAEICLTYSGRNPEPSIEEKSEVAN
jgi:membrane protein